MKYRCTSIKTQLPNDLVPFYVCLKGRKNYVVISLPG